MLTGAEKLTASPSWLLPLAFGEFFAKQTWKLDWRSFKGALPQKHIQNTDNDMTSVTVMFLLIGLTHLRNIFQFFTQNLSWTRNIMQYPHFPGSKRTSMQIFLPPLLPAAGQQPKLTAAALMLLQRATRCCLCLLLPKNSTTSCFSRAIPSWKHPSCGHLLSPVRPEPLARPRFYRPRAITCLVCKANRRKSSETK